VIDLPTGARAPRGAVVWGWGGALKLGAGGLRAWKGYGRLREKHCHDQQQKAWIQCSYVSSRLMPDEFEASDSLR
jgi:hypothetical protein